MPVQDFGVQRLLDDRPRDGGVVLVASDGRRIRLLRHLSRAMGDVDGGVALHGVRDRLEVLVGGELDPGKLRVVERHRRAQAVVELSHVGVIPAGVLAQPAARAVSCAERRPTLVRCLDFVEPRAMLGTDALTTPPDRPTANPSLGRQSVVAHHKRRRPKQRRAGCLLCKPQKLTANKKSARAAAAKAWRRLERRAW